MDIQSTNISGGAGNPSNSTGQDFAITDNAARQIKLLSEEEPAGAMFRIAVNGGGCSGFKYEFSFDAKKNADDMVFENSGAKVVIDEISLGFVKGSGLDYVETLGSAAFEIKNPLATATCGCGSSFAI